LPGGQPWQAELLVAPIRVPIVPGSHALHSERPPSEAKRPAGHSSQSLRLVEPALGPYVPSLQPRQAEEPDSVL